MTVDTHRFTDDLKRRSPMKSSPEVTTATHSGDRFLLAAVHVNQTTKIEGD